MHRSPSRCNGHAIIDLTSLLRQTFTSARLSTQYRDAVFSAPTTRRWRRVKAPEWQHGTIAAGSKRQYTERSSADVLVDAYDDESKPLLRQTPSREVSRPGTRTLRFGKQEKPQATAKQELRRSGAPSGSSISSRSGSIKPEILLLNRSPSPRPTTQPDIRARHQWEREQISQTFASFTELVFNGRPRLTGSTVEEENALRSAWIKDLKQDQGSHILKLGKTSAVEETTTKATVDENPGFKIHRSQPLVDTYNNRPSMAGICAVMPRLPDHEFGEHQLPWQLDKRLQRDMSGIDVLSGEIDRAAAFLLPTNAELAARDKVANRVYHRVGDILAKHNVRMAMHGSACTGLATALADLDFNILDESDRPSLAARSALHDLRHEVFTAKKTSLENDQPDADFVLTTFHHVQRSPLFQLHHQLTGVDVQIIAGSSTRSQAGRTHAWLREYPFVKTIFVVMRAALQMRGLNDTHTCGINSWVLLNMIMACVVRQNYVSTLPTLGDQLLHTLRYLGEYPIDRFGLCARTGKPLPKRMPIRSAAKAHSKEMKLLAAALYRHAEKGKLGWLNFQRFQDSKPWTMALQDATAHDRILGPSAHAIEYIQDTFRFLHAKLQIGIREHDEARARGEAWEHDSILEPMLGRIHEVEMKRRRQLITGQEAMSRISKKERKARYTANRRSAAIGADLSEDNTSKEQHHA